MPAVSVSSRLSDAVYFAAIIALSLLLARPVYLVYSASQQRAAEVVSSGIASALDSMSPGTSFVASLQGYPGVKLSVTLSGTSVEASCGGASATAHVRWDLPRATLAPGQAYNFTLEGGSLEVTQALHG